MCAHAFRLRLPVGWRVCPEKKVIAREVNKRAPALACSWAYARARARLCVCVCVRLASCVFVRAANESEVCVYV